MLHLVLLLTLFMVSRKDLSNTALLLVLLISGPTSLISKVSTVCFLAVLVLIFIGPLAHLGEQEVLNKEIYAQGTSVDDEVFGYQERYAEYRYFPSQITGKFRSTYAQPLMFGICHKSLTTSLLCPVSSFRRIPLLTV